MDVLCVLAAHAIEARRDRRRQNAHLVPERVLPVLLRLAAGVLGVVTLFAVLAMLGQP